MTGCDTNEPELLKDKVLNSKNWKAQKLLDFSYQEPISSWMTDKDYLMEQPQYELEVNYYLTDSDGSL